MTMIQEQRTVSKGILHKNLFYFNQFSCEIEDINMNMQIRYTTLNQNAYNSKYKFCSLIQKK